MLYLAFYNLYKYHIICCPIFHLQLLPDRGLNIYLSKSSIYLFRWWLLLYCAVCLRTVVTFNVLIWTAAVFVIISTWWSADPVHFELTTDIPGGVTQNINKATYSGKLHVILPLCLDVQLHVPEIGTWGCVKSKYYKPLCFVCGHDSLTILSG